MEVRREGTKGKEEREEEGKGIKDMMQRKRRREVIRKSESEKKLNGE